ncbi:MAG TPA: hypothetical protein VNX68_13220 [Nitrosopumilaceae archaeon]|nr:hypothetical protein [Nitrosopumilaceae archaeon]
MTTNNVKTIKSVKYGVTTYILYMSPFNQNSQKKNICPMATVGCSSACLFGSGKGSLSTVIKGRTNKTEFFLKDRELFLKMIYSEVAKIAVKHEIEGGDFAIRLNGTSDISWEKFKIKDGKNIFELFKSVTFYDYTKNYLRFKNILPSNYRLIFSRSETNENIAMELIKKGINLAVVFDEIPKMYKGHTVIDGDLHDMRFGEKKGIIIGLKYKKVTTKGFDNDAAFKSGFAIKVAEQKIVIKKAA